MRLKRKSQITLSSGNPAVFAVRRPVAFRHHLTMGLAFTRMCTLFHEQEKLSRVILGVRFWVFDATHSAVCLHDLNWLGFTIPAATDARIDDWLNSLNRVRSGIRHRKAAEGPTRRGSATRSWDPAFLFWGAFSPWLWGTVWGKVKNGNKKGTQNLS